MICSQNTRTNIQGQVLTHSQGHDTKLVADQLDHLALLQWCGPAADDCFAFRAELQEVTFQQLLQGPVQRTAIYDQDEV